MRAGTGKRPGLKVGGVVMAAGLSRRFGSNKLISPFMGKPLVRWVVEAALESRLAPIAVVLGHEHERVQAALTGLQADARLAFVHNDRHRQGQSSSVSVGLAAIESIVDAAMFLPADQPRLDCAVIDRLIAAFEQSGRGICHPAVAGRRYGPAVFGSHYFPALRRLQGDAGGRSVIETNRDAAIAVSFPDETPFRDVDCPDDLAAFGASSTEVNCNRPRTELVHGLGLAEARLIAICGAGGKTSLMAALARELSACGSRVLATTTTKMAIEEAEGPWRACEADGAAALLAHAGADPTPVLGFRTIDRARGRLIGFAPEVVDMVAEQDRFDRIIVEADGAARKPLKAPGRHEPVFPRSTDTVIIVAGASGLGQPLDDRTVFRAERWASVTGLHASQPVTPASLARMAVNPEGLARGAPGGSRRVLFVNQADAPERLAAAGHVLDCVFGLGGLAPERAAAGWLKPAPVIRLMREREGGEEDK